MLDLPRTSSTVLFVDVSPDSCLLLVEIGHQDFGQFDVLVARDTLGF